MERFERLSALVAAFESDPPDLRGDETQWCLDMWQHIRPFLEDVALPRGVKVEERPRPSNATDQEIVVVDSQEPVMEDGSKRQMVQLENGTQRDLTEEEKKR